MTTFITFLEFIAVLVGGGFAVTRRWDYTPYSALMQQGDECEGFDNAIQQRCQRLGTTIQARQHRKQTQVLPPVSESGSGVYG